MIMGMQNNNINAATRLQVLPQNTLLQWQITNHKHIISIPELPRYHTIIMVTYN